MFTGAMASSYYGRPRTTLDIDIVISAKENHLVGLAKELSDSEFRVEAKKLQDTWGSDDKIVTIKDNNSPHTVDIIFADQRLERRAGRILGLPTYYQTPESLVLAKLRMIKVTIQAERAVTDREDIKAILKATRINLKSLRKRAASESTLRILNDLMATPSLK